MGISEGDRVAICEIGTDFAQRRNLYNQVMWTKSHVMMLGHVGFVNKMDTNRNVATVTVFCYSKTSHERNYSLKQIKTDWPIEALDNSLRIYFACGDSVALSRGSHKVCMATINGVEIDENGQSTYSLITNIIGDVLPRSVTISTNQSAEARRLIMLPIYVGAGLTHVMREDNSPPIHTFKHVLHGYTNDSLMTVISNWRENTTSYAKLVETIRFNPEQVRMPYEGELPLFRAVADNCWSLVVVLVALGANKLAKDHQHRTLLHIAAMRGLDSMLEGVLHLVGKEVNRGTSEGDTALHLAARNAQAACIDRLLMMPNCNPNIQNENGDTPLHEACGLAESSNKKAVIGRLLSNTRASIHQTNNQDLSALQIAILNGHSSTVEQLVQLRPSHRNESRSGMTPLHFAASCANVNIINTLITLGLEVHRKDKTGRGVLHYAVDKWTGQAEKDMARLACVQALVHAGAPLNAVDAHGHTVVHCLVREMTKWKEVMNAGLTSVCLQLVRTNMNLDEMACRLRPRWQLATVCFLASKGADMMIKDRRGETAIEMCREGTLRSVLLQIANLKIRSCLPMMSVKQNEFDSTEVTMCTFMCQDSIADVRFMPCAHRVACADCAQRTAFRRCPLCYQIVTCALDNDGQEIVIGSKAGEASEKSEKSLLSEQVMRKIAEEAAREAKIAVEQEKQNELKALRERLEQLEMETSCSICMDAKITMVFNCGHTACGDCASKLKLCHICRCSIASTQTIYS